MRRDILAIDVGTTAFKIGVFSPDFQKRCEASREYRCNLYDHGKADIETEKWWQALKDCCVETKEFLTKVGTISFSVTTPGLVAMVKLSMEISYDFSTPPFVLSLSKGKRLVCLI